MTKAVTTAQTQLNLAVVALVALVAIVGLVALVMNTESGQGLQNAGLTPVLDNEGNQVGYSLVVDFAVGESQVSEGQVAQENMVGDVSRRTRDLKKGPVRR